MLMHVPMAASHTLVLFGPQSCLRSELDPLAIAWGEKVKWWLVADTPLTALTAAGFAVMQERGLVGLFRFEELEVLSAFFTGLGMAAETHRANDPKHLFALRVLGVRASKRGMVVMFQDAADERDVDEVVLEVGSC